MNVLPFVSSGFRRSRSALTRAERHALYWLARYQPIRPAKRKHGLPARLAVSLTSYPARFPTLAATIRCLLSQTVRPDHTVLWIAHGDMEYLPNSIISLRGDGLVIRQCEDLKSYKKLIPALEAYPDHYIVTADDDVYYWDTWLEALVDRHDPYRREVLCHRAHRIRHAADGNLLPYSSWEWDVGPGDASPLLFPTGSGGVLYPPNVLDPQASNATEFLSLCPHHDDAWFYWMARLGGAASRKIGDRTSLITWPRSQQQALGALNALETNDVSHNDQQIRNLIATYGLPVEAVSKGHSAEFFRLATHE